MLHSFLLFQIIILFNFSNAQLTYNDQKQNCSARATANFCYGGSRFDSIGQYKSCSVPGTMALTFDDGPSNNIPAILDTLRLYNMKATFFLIGFYIYSYSNPALIQRMVDEGHQIASHTYNHTWPIELTDDKFREELRGFENALLQRNYNGILSNWQIPNYFRAPHGALDASKIAVLNEFNYIPIHWGYLNGDSYTTNPEDILPLHKSHLGGEYGTLNLGIDVSNLNVIIQQHDREFATASSFADLAFWLYNTFGTRGLRFTTIADCLGGSIPAYRTTPRRYEDPTCSNGIPLLTTTSASVCCNLACGTCGGTGCGSKWIKSSNDCCQATIVAANISCRYSRAPCVL